MDMQIPVLVDSMMHFISHHLVQESPAQVCHLHERFHLLRKCPVIWRTCLIPQDCVVVESKNTNSSFFGMQIFHVLNLKMLCHRQFQRMECIRMCVPTTDKKPSSHIF